MTSYIPQPIAGFTTEQTRQIIEALNKKLRGFCPGCSMHGTFQLMTDGIVYMPVTQPPPIGLASLYSPPSYPSLSGPPTRNLPCIALTCTNCGFLQFHSALQLGLSSVLGLSVPPVYGGI